MAMNPMQRKANNYLIIGVLVTLLITGTIIALLCIQLMKIQEQRQTEKDALQNVYVVTSTIKSGDVIDTSLLELESAPSDVIPSSMISIEEITENTIAKIDLTPGTVITAEMVTEIEDKTTSDVRKQEYNMILLPTQLQTGEYIDIRLRLPNGVDYIVVSKKKVELPVINGVDSENTIWLNMSEAETLAMSNAIVEAYIMTGSLLYATTYIEPGMQQDATPTYVPSGKVQEALYLNPNVEQEAKSVLISRYNNTSSIRTQTITEALSPYTESASGNVDAGIQNEINKSTQARQQYLESLGAAYSVTMEEEYEED